MTVGIGNCSNYTQTKVQPNELLELSVVSQISIVLISQGFVATLIKAPMLGTTGMEWKEEAETSAL